MDHKAIIKAALFTPGIKGSWGLPILFEGPPGVGKTAGIDDINQSCGLHGEVLISSLREPADFLGLPIPDGTRTKYLAPAWAVRALEAERAVVFLDELNTAPPAVQAALLRCVNERAVGDLKLPNGVRFLAAQNKTEEAAGGWDLAPPMANRFGHLPWPAPEVQQWTTWMLGGAGAGRDDEGAMDAAAEEKRVLAAFDKPFAIAKGLVTGFLRARQDLLHNQPKSGDPNASRAWPSPRTWEMATRALASARVHGLVATDEDEMIAAFIGQGAAGEFFTFRQNADLPDPEDLLDEKVTFEHDARRLDRTCAVMSSCAALLASPTLKKRESRGKSMWKLLGGIVGDNADLAVPACLSMVQSKLIGLAEARPVLAKLAPILRAAGVRPQGT